MRFGIVPGLYESLLAGAETVPIQGEPIIVLPPLDTKREKWLSTLERLVAMISLILLIPDLFTIGILVKIDSPGTIFYGQERVGKQERTFKLWKFRTMIMGAEEKTGPVLCVTNDERVTRLGIFLRRTHLDELPQLWNIVRGEMSWVGPRPERPVLVHQYEERLSDYGLRHLVKPGLTGEAQLNLDYTSSPEAKLAYDLHHLKRERVF